MAITKREKNRNREGNTIKPKAVVSLLLVIPVLLISLISPAASPGQVRGDTEEEKQQQSQATETKESEASTANDTQAASPEQQQESETAKKYRGAPGTFIFNEADLKHVLLFFARTYKLNMVLDPGISGKVTCRLVNVPWDQALEFILKQHGLAMVKEGNLLTPRKVDK